MKITLLCSDVRHPVYAVIQQWAASRSRVHEISLESQVADLDSGDFLFMVSCSEIVEIGIRERFVHSLVVHASDLPHGRGWSPHIWQILEGKDSFVVTLLEAEDQVDSGAIWQQETVHLAGHELANEIDVALFAATVKLLDFAIENGSTVVPRRQADSPASYYRKRKPEDSRVNPALSIAEQFDLLRVADPKRYPSFFDFRGKRYILSIVKSEDHQSE